MPVRSGAFGTLAAVSCGVLSWVGHPAHATPEAPRTHHKPASSTATAVEVPVFQPGLWRYRQTVMKDDSVAPQISVLQRCADPSTEIRGKMVQLGHKGCHFAPLARRRGRYITSWTCPTPLGLTRFRAVLMVRGAVSYTDLSEMRAATHVARQRIDAAWIGECPASAPGGQLR